MWNAIVWVVVLLLLVIVAGKIPKSAFEWRVIDVAAIFFWLAAGALLVIRFLWRFVTR